MSETSDAGRLVQAYLASKGLQPTGENVSRALMMNAQNPGLIGGLVNQAPPSPSDPAPQAAQPMQRPTPQAQPAQQPQAMPVPPIPPQAPSTTAPVSAPPQDDNSMSWAAKLGLGGAGAAAMAGLGKLLFGGGSSGGASPATAQPVPAAPPAEQLPAELTPHKLTPIDDPMERAMNKAVESPTGMPALEMSAPAPSSVAPYVHEGEIMPPVRSVVRPGSGMRLRLRAP